VRPCAEPSVAVACRIQASGAPAYACGWAIPPGRRDAAAAALAGDVRNCLEGMVTASSPQPGGQSLQLDNGMRVGIDAAEPGLILSLAPPSGPR